MTTIKHTLQRQVFLPSEERLVQVVHVTKSGKKKKDSFLCATVTTEKPIQAMIYEVKRSERGDVFKKKISWAMRDLKVLDAKDSTKDVAEFDMHCDKIYRWVASSIIEKNAFIQCLYKLSQRYVVQKPEFVNVPPSVLEEFSHTTQTDKSVQEVEAALGIESDYQALTPREENDLESLMSQCDFAISNAEKFSEQLAGDLSVLDGANIHSIMGSEEQVLELMLLLDEGLLEANKLEEKLDEYDHKLQSLKDLMEIMKDKDSLLKIRNKNHNLILEQVDSIITSLDLEPSQQKALMDGNLSTTAGIEQCIQAAEALQKCMSAEIHPSLEKMAAVQEQRKRFERLKGAFVKRLSHHLNNLFIHQGNELGETLSRHASDLKLPQHNSSHIDLLPYSDLMAWLKKVDKPIYQKLAKVYTGSLSKLYDRELKDFMEAAKNKLQPRFERKGSLAPGSTPLRGSSQSLNRGTLSVDVRLPRNSSQTTLDSDSHHGSGQDLSDGTKFDQMFELVLSELAPFCLAEQDFCVRFFHLTSSDAPDAASKQDEEGAGGGEEGPWVPRRPTTSKERQINEEVRAMMRELFPSLEPELLNFIDFGDRLHNLNSLYMLVRMGDHVINAEDTGSFLTKTFAFCLVNIKSKFDTYVKMQITQIEEFKLSKKSRVGIISFVHRFEEFARQAETIFRGSERRTDLDKAYIKLVTCVFDQIGRVANESQKTPREVVHFENYHHMFAALSQLKIASLESHRKDAKQRYQERLQAYVTNLLGRPMEKLSLFFEGVEAKVASGVKEEEIGYQLAYSKTELRKVIKEYPGKEVKKNLEQLYKKVDKQLCEEENLMQVVWHNMQDEFLKQYQRFESLITRCYPGAGMSLEFTIDDLLAYFSDIAQSH